jgi:protein-disulfide isomerase
VGLRLVTPEVWAQARVSRVVPGTKLVANSQRWSPNVRLASGLDDSGHPYIGAAHPSLTITEFADYQCPHCANAHIEMRELVAKNPGTVRIIHRHFPLDARCNSLVKHPFHIHACAYAELAACASLLGKFWDANDYLFDHGRDETTVTAEALAQALALDAQSLRQCAEKTGVEIVKQDVEEGLQLKIEGTPSFLVDGKVYKGQLPEGILAPYD